MRDGSDARQAGQTTVAAIATPPGTGGIGIIRVSGPQASRIAERITRSRPIPAKAQHRSFLDREEKLIDDGVLVYFAAPHSYTGEDVCEFQCHGSPVVLKLLLSEIMALGACMAQPGEFTRRAFLNGRLDLAQAEAVADLINASTEAAARSASRSLRGDFSAMLDRISDAILRLRVHIEAAIDFPEEEIDFLDDAGLMDSVDALHAELLDLVNRSGSGRLLRDGLAVVIAGRPNAGKSSLLNCFAGEERAIVTDIPGTTRDLVELTVDIDGLAVHMTDTAGLREASDVVELEGVNRAWNALAEAGMTLYVIDNAAGYDENDADNIARLDASRLVVVWNKIDLAKDCPAEDLGVSCPQARVSAVTGEGLRELRGLIQQVAGVNASDDSLILARKRHLDAIERAAQHVAQARRALKKRRAGELAAEDLRHAHDALGEIVGAVSSDALLGEIFASFCIGK